MNKVTKTLSSASGLAFTAGVFLIPASIAFAAGVLGDDAVNGFYTPLTTIPGIITAGVATNPVTIIKGIYGLAIGIGSVIATVMIIWAGFEYMYVEAIGKKSAAKERITNAFLGLLVILSSYILLRTINPDLVNFNVTLPGGSGSSGLAGLIAQQKAQDAAQQTIREANQQYAESQAQIASLKNTSDALNVQIASLQKQRDLISASTTLSAADKASQLKKIQSDIGTILEDAQNLTESINQKTAQAINTNITAIFGADLTNTLINEGAAFKRGNYLIDQVFVNIISKEDSAAKRLDNDLIKLQALPESPGKAKLIAQFQVNASTYKDYLNTTKNITLGIKHIMEAPTPGVDLEREISIKEGQLQAFKATAIQVAQAYYAKDQKILGDQIKANLENILEITSASLAASRSLKRSTVNIVL